MQDVALAIALDYLDDLPITEPVEIRVSIYSDLAYDCLEEVAGCFTFFSCPFRRLSSYRWWLL